MKKSEFVKVYGPFAKQSEAITGISAIASLAQAAVESAWGDVCPGNMLFGIKDTDGVNGNEQLLTTTEYSRSANAKFPNIIRVKPVLIRGKKFYKYTIKDYFREYDSPEQSFTDHSNFFIKNKRYSEALKVKSDPYKFIDEIAKAGYATGPDYATLLKGIAKSIEKLI